MIFIIMHNWNPLASSGRRGFGDSVLATIPIPKARVTNLWSPIAIKHYTHTMRISAPGASTFGEY